MHFSFALTVAVTLTGAFASPRRRDDVSAANFDLSASNCYNAPQPPWQSGAHPGWAYGYNAPSNNQYPCLEPGSCNYLRSHHGQLQCPPGRPFHNPPGYHETFHNLSGATQASDYLTYGLVETISDCLAMCNSVAGCVFANTYHDVNGKNGSPELTCALFSECHDSSDADNYGGQTQPDGTVDYIIDSDGWCKGH